MQAEDLVFWIDALPEDDTRDVGVLCRRHADSMVVPRGWTLDDRRDPDLHLFRPPTPLPAPVRRPARSTSRSTRSVNADSTGEQLRLSEETLAQYDEPAPTTEPEQWIPDFDETDDLDGLLSARSPLLSRAFRTADRTDG
jgi:hypothetical protein